jgi:hypothetical protein
MFVMNNQVFSQQYFQFGSLNVGSVSVGDWTILNTGTHNFTVGENNTTVEIYVNSRLAIGSLSANGVRFQVRIDDVTLPDFDNMASIRSANTSEFQTIFAVFENVSAGAHTVSIWAQTAPTSGSADGVLVDPGGWGGKIIVKSFLTTTAVEPENQDVPEEFTLQQNYPNPFNPSTTIRYSITTPENVTIKIYDIAGKLIYEIAREHNQAGEYEVVWDGKNNFGERVSSGAYLYQIVAGDHVKAQKMILLK